MTEAAIKETKTQINDLNRILRLCRWACDPQAELLAQRIALLMQKVESAS